MFCFLKINFLQIPYYIPGTLLTIKGYEKNLSLTAIYGRQQLMICFKRHLLKITRLPKQQFLVYFWCKHWNKTLSEKHMHVYIMHGGVITHHENTKYVPIIKPC